MNNPEDEAGLNHEIAAAERRLAEALDDLERARATLSQRERELLGLLRRAGRLPEPEEANQPDMHSDS